MGKASRSVRSIKRMGLFPKIDETLLRQRADLAKENQSPNVNETVLGSLRLSKQDDSRPTSSIDRYEPSNHLSASIAVSGLGA
jgi:hypothetical protein